MLRVQLFKIVAYFICIYYVSAQTTVIPESITIKEGLSQGFVSSIVQDKEGFIWMGTKNGLNRYDGEHFEAFINDLDKPYSISGNFIYALHDDDGFILIGTDEGLNLYHKKTKRFHKILLDDFNSFEPIITSIVKDEINQYWIAETKTKSLYRLIIPNQFLDTIKKDTKTLKGLRIEKNKNVKNIYPHFLSKYKEGIIYVSQHKKDDGKWEKVFNVLNVKTGKLTQLNSAVFNDSQDRFKYIISKNRIVLSFWGRSYLRVFENDEWRTVYSNFVIKGISFTKESNQVLVEGNGSYMIFNDKVLSQEHVHKKDALIVFPEIKINHTGWIQDTSGNNWIATAGYGVVKIGYRQSKIETHFKGKSIYAEPFIDNQGNFYIGNAVTNERLFFSNSKSEASRLKKFITNNNQEPFLCYLIQDKKETIWALYYEDGDYSIVKENGLKSIEKKVIGKTDLLYTPIMTYDENSHTLLIAFEEKLVVYNIDKDDLKSYDFKNLFNNSVNRYDVIRTSNGQYWVGTNNGLVQIAPNSNGSYDLWLFNKRNGLRSNEVASLYVSSNDKNTLWIGTKGGGLHCLNIKEMSFDYINSKNGLPNNVIYGILEDENKNLWMSSNKGIISYNKQTKEIRNFNEADGLQSNEFNTYAYAKGPEGKMFFGGINGLNVFHPNNFNKNNTVPKVWITGLEVNNHKIEYGDTSRWLNKSIEYTTSITLPYNQNNISLHFVALEYTAPSNNKFSYYLDGGEEEWVHTTKDNKANYLNITPGNYIFKIKAANGDGIWSDDVKELRIQILAPWYKTGFAYLLYLISGVFFFFTIVKIREDKIRSKQQIEKSELNNKILKMEVEYKQKDLVDLAVEISENQKWGNYLLNSVKKIRGTKGRTKGKYFDKLEEDIKDKIFVDKNKIEVQNRIDLLNNEFYQNLLKKFPNLTKTDLKLCSLIRLNLTTNEIAIMQNITSESVYKSRKRLRKRLKLSSDIDLDVFLKHNTSS